MAHVRSNTSVTLVELRRSLIPQKWEEHGRVIGISEHKEAALSLAQSFATDDLAQYLVGSDDMSSYTAEAKWRLHVDIMTYTVAAHCYSGVVTTIGPDYEGIALWVPPGMSGDNWWTIFRSGMWRLYYKLSPEGKQRFYDELLPLLHDTKAAVMGERMYDCYYLDYIGTKSSGRGRGYARKLIEEMAVKADAEGRPMYLESSSPANTAYYHRFGFEIQKEIALGKGDSCVKLWVMVREPQKPAYTKTVPIKLQSALKGV